MSLHVSATRCRRMQACSGSDPRRRQLQGVPTSWPSALGAREVVVPFAAAADHGAAERRSFRILLGPHNGSTRATMFVGLVRPGKASLHYHLYDEIVWTPSGPGRFHLADGGEELRAGSSFRLRPRQLHVVENTGT